MSSEVREMMADYAAISVDAECLQAKARGVMQLLRTMSQDHRYNLDTRLACMAQLLDDNRELWCRA